LASARSGNPPCLREGPSRLARGAGRNCQMARIGSDGRKGGSGCPKEPSLSFRTASAPKRLPRDGFDPKRQAISAVSSRSQPRPWPPSSPGSRGDLSWTARGRPTFPSRDPAGRDPGRRWLRGGNELGGRTPSPYCARPPVVERREAAKSLALSGRCEEFSPRLAVSASPAQADDSTRSGSTESCQPPILSSADCRCRVP
jgi:hypothetical protein